MRKALLGLAVVGLMSLAAACDEAPPAGMTESTLVALTGPDGQTVTVDIPVDLALLEQRFQAIGGSGGGGFFGVDLSVANGFETNINVPAGYAAGVPMGTYSAAGGYTAQYSAAMGCDVAAAVCQFGSAACAYLGPIASDLAKSMGEGPEAGVVDVGSCQAAACNADVEGGIGELLGGIPPAAQCALVGVLNCLSTQLPALAAALSGGIEGEGELIGALVDNLAVCVGPYVALAEGMMGAGSTQVGGPVEMP